MQADIKPCKCGGEPYLDIGYLWNGKIYYFIKCPKCKEKTRDYKTQEQAINDWNRRIVKV